MATSTAASRRVAPFAATLPRRRSCAQGNPSKLTTVKCHCLSTAHALLCSPRRKRGLGGKRKESLGWLPCTGLPPKLASAVQPLMAVAPRLHSPPGSREPVTTREGPLVTAEPSCSKHPEGPKRTCTLPVSVVCEPFIHPAHQLAPASSGTPAAGVH